MRLQFTIPGRPVTGNHARRLGRGRIRLTEEARDFRERVKQHVFVAVRMADWLMPPYVRMDVTLWNIRQDRDNALKELQDALQGLAYPNDSRILDGWTAKRKDRGEQRIEVCIEPVDPRLYGYR